MLSARPFSAPPTISARAGNTLSVANADQAHLTNLSPPNTTAPMASARPGMASARPLQAKQEDLEGENTGAADSEAKGEVEVDIGGKEAPSTETGNAESNVTQELPRPFSIPHRFSHRDHNADGLQRLATRVSSPATPKHGSSAAHEARASTATPDPMLLRSFDRTVTSCPPLTLKRGRLWSTRPASGPATTKSKGRLVLQSPTITISALPTPVRPQSAASILAVRSVDAAPESSVPVEASDPTLSAPTGPDIIPEVDPNPTTGLGPTQLLPDPTSGQMPSALPSARPGQPQPSARPGQPQPSTWPGFIPDPDDPQPSSRPGAAHFSHPHLSARPGSGPVPSD